MIAPGLTVHAGMSGAGKTHAIRAEVWEYARAGVPVLVIDRMREWTAVPPDLHGAARGASSVESAKKCIEGGTRLVVVRPRINAGRDAAEAAFQWACEHEGLAAVAIPEAHAAIPKTLPLDGSSEWTAAVLGEWRHHNVRVWADSQRFAKLNTELVELAHTLRLFAMAGPNDIRRLHEVVDYGGDELRAQIGEAAARVGRGDRGWHVHLTLDRRPPFDLVRV